MTEGFEKKMQCKISRANNPHEVYKNKTSIGLGAGGRVVKVLPDIPVCIWKGFYYSVTDAVIDHAIPYKDENGEAQVKRETIRRFHIEPSRYMFCNKACNNVPEDCTGIEIHHGEFFAEGNEEELKEKYLHGRKEKAKTA